MPETVEGPPVISDEREREEAKRKIGGGWRVWEGASLTRREFLKWGMIGGGVMLLNPFRRGWLNVWEKWRIYNESRGISQPILGREVELGWRERTKRVKQREAEWTYLLTGKETASSIPRTIGIFGQGTNRNGGLIDVNQKETWVNSNLGEELEALSEFVKDLRTTEGRKELKGIITQAAESANSDIIRGYADLLENKFTGELEYRQYGNDKELLEGFFGETSRYNETELAIFRGALNIWKNGEATIILKDGTKTTLKDLVNKYNEDNQTGILPLK